MEERIRRAMVVIDAYAENADSNVAHALERANESDGVAQRLWLAECEKERTRAAALRSAGALVRAALEEGEGA
jgi:hypothetical protein